MKNKKNIVLVIIILILLISIFFIKEKLFKYNINSKIGQYNIIKNRDSYLEYVKKYVKPEGLRKFINNGYVNLSIYSEEATGNDILWELEFEGYENLFREMFNKERKDYNDCPVTKFFKNKFNNNLLLFFDLEESEDCSIDCLLKRDEKQFIIDVYGNYESFEPTYWKKHYFHYMLDENGNVNDVIFDYTE